jgi:hypothetical protein
MSEKMNEKDNKRGEREVWISSRLLFFIIESEMLILFLGF